MSFEAAFFHALHSAEDAHYAQANGYNSEPEYAEGYDFVMDEVKDAVASGEFRIEQLIDKLHASVDETEQEYAEGFYDAARLCEQALSGALAATAV